MGAGRSPVALPLVWLRRCFQDGHKKDGEREGKKDTEEGDGGREGCTGVTAFPPDKGASWPGQASPARSHTGGRWPSAAESGARLGLGAQSLHVGV